MPRPIVVKCHLTTHKDEGIEIRRFLYPFIDIPTVAVLKDYVRTLYTQLKGEKLEFLYLDDDNERVVFSTDDELELAWLEVTESEDPKQQLQLYVCVSSGQHGQ
ncbi:uncharacterized protein LOC124196758 [Daphnia pulex]|uniref:uncharacterized protein LOC124196758 n=1 Tax=Daphnia pulex TaxID=6669 RepID=UPI001EDFBA5B|nr:uncharacterized protein LOC124196758 [Daphnia pulex]